MSDSIILRIIGGIVSLHGMAFLAWVSWQWRQEKKRNSSRLRLLSMLTAPDARVAREFVVQWREGPPDEPQAPKTVGFHR